MVSEVFYGPVLAEAAAASNLFAILAGALVAGAIALVFMGVQRVADSRGDSPATRLDTLLGAAPDAEQTERKNPLKLFGGRKGDKRVRLDESASKSFMARLARELAQADVRVTAGEFLVVSTVLASIGALLGVAMPIPGRWVLGAVLLLAGAFGPRIWLKRKKAKRLNAFNNQLSDVINMMAGALRSGQGITQAMDLVSRQAPSPSGEEFGRVVREIGLNIPPEQALGNLLYRMQSDDLELFVTAVSVQREVGGNMVEVLDTISATIRDRAKLFGEVRVLTAQQQYSGYIIALLPIALSVMLAVINPSYILGVFQTTTWFGWVLVSIAGAMLLAGFVAIRKIVNIKV